MKRSLKNKLLALVMAVMLLCSVSPIGALADELGETPAVETAEPTPEVEVTAEPEETAAPESTPEPEETAAPENTPEPEETAVPENTPEPEETAVPENTPEPEETAAPENTPEPQETPADEDNKPETDESDIATTANLPSDGGTETDSSVTVTFAASESTFIVLPTTLEVKPNIAKDYGYENAEGVTGPTFLDAVVAAHIAKYGEETFKANPTEYLVCSNGYFYKVFGVSTYSIACMVNGRMPGNASLAPNAAEIQNGDVVQLIIYQGYSYDYNTGEMTCDDYCTFTEQTKTVAAGANFTLTLKGHSLATEMWGTAVANESLVGAYVLVCPVDAKGDIGAPIADPDGLTTDENGQITLSIPTDGDYLLTVTGYSPDGNALTLPWCRVTVGSTASLSFWSNMSNSAVEYKMTPAFSAKTYTYTLTVPDNTSTLCINAAPDGDTPATVSYAKKPSGTSYSGTLASGKKTSLSQAIKYNSDESNTLTLSMDGKTYTINVVREATLQSLTVKNGDETLALTPAFKAADSTRSFEMVFAGAELTVTPKARVTGNKVTVDGKEPTSGSVVVTPVWENHEYSFDIAIQNAANTSSGKYTIRLLQTPSGISVQTPPDKTEYQVGEAIDLTGLTLTASYAGGSTETIEAADVELVSNGYAGADDVLVLRYRDMTTTQKITITNKLSGTGTEADPYILATAADLTQLSQMTARGESFAGKYFKITADITLPADWTPIGCTKDGTNDIKKGENLNAFSGTIDGNGKLLTVPKDGLPLLGYVKGAAVKNLNIYGEKIAGYGLVNNFVGVGLSGTAIVIDNVTLKSGTQTQKSGLLGTYITTNQWGGVSGTFVAEIKNCTVEEGVVIGYDGDQENIGSFAGRFNGTITNCVSRATVKGTNAVGGIVGLRDSSGGSCTIDGCTFSGTVEATGNYVGGIMGSGYNDSSGPNAYCVTIKGCRVSGSITGCDYVGGIFGAEPGVVQCWKNGSGSIQNNTFTGSIKSDGTYVGGVIGYMHSLNRYTEILGNVYLGTGDGADKGIGGVQYVDTSCATHETASGAQYFNTANHTSKNCTCGHPVVTGCGIVVNSNRTDDPLGADKESLTTKNAPSVAVEVAIDAIGTVTAGSADAIAAARSAYDALKADEKTAVSNYAKLTAAEAALEKIQAAAAVDALIEAIGEPEAVTRDSKTAIEAARAAYDALDEAVRALVTNYSKLTAAERRLEALDPQGGTKVIGTGDTKLVLDGVTYMVDAEAANLMKRIADLRDAGGMDDNGILDAYRTYDAMGSDLKAQVFNYADLEALCTALGVRGHRSGGLRAEGLPWYVGIEAEAIENGDDYDAVAGSIGRNELLALWHIAFINRLTGDVFVPYDTVTLRVNAPEYDAALSSLRMALYSGGRVAYSDCTVTDGELAFAVTEGGVYGFIGGAEAAAEALVEEEPAEEPTEETVTQAETPEAETAPESVEPTPQPEENASLLWLWIVIGLLGVCVLVAVVVIKQKDRKAKHAVR